MTKSITGYEDLPILQYKDDILKAIDENQVTIVEAETGAGKSTQLPQYLAEHGYERIIVTEPRILAARNLNRRTRKEWAARNNEDASDVIGYRTASERDDSGHTKILYCTDGLQLVRELTGIGVTKKQVLVLDEVHEWNENIEVLVAWAKRRTLDDPNFKVVIMSATIDLDRLATFFNTKSVISVPGRTFDVEWHKSDNLTQEIFNAIDAPETKNVLVFLPGKSEIEAVGEIISQKAQENNIIVLPLHSQLELDEQQKVFEHYPDGKIILSTNIAQTSVTISDIDLVIDSGLERRIEVRDGVEGLFIGEISQSDVKQRAGRAGRTKEGEYYLAKLDEMPSSKFEKRAEFATPEILRTHIDRTVLRLANIDLDIEQMDFFHNPSMQSIKQAKRTLKALGALTPAGGITEIGRKMERFPLSSSYARMMVQAENESREVQTHLATIIALQEVGGIVRGSLRYSGWKKFTHQTKSDLLAEYDVWRTLDDINPEDYEELGIIAKNIEKAQLVVERLERDLNLIPSAQLGRATKEENIAVSKCIVAGQIDQLWQPVNRYGGVEHIFHHQKRELSNGSIVRRPDLMVGTPFNLEVPRSDGSLETLELLQGITTVDPLWLPDIAPNLFIRKRNKILYKKGRKQIRLFIFNQAEKSSRDNNSGNRYKQEEGNNNRRKNKKRMSKGFRRRYAK